MYLNWRQTGQVGIQQTQPGILGIVITDVERNSALGRARIQRLTPDTRVGDAGPV
jgi:hypothetical protein